MGNAEAGMCIDFYGRIEANETGQEGPPRLRFVAPRNSTSVGADPIALLRGAPHRELALAFLEFAISIEGQKLWDFKVGTPGGPVRSALRRLPILPALYEPKYAPFRADPDENPYRDSDEFTYHPAWTAPLFRPISFIVRTMCVDTHDELREAYRALQEHGFPPRATALFDDVSMVTYDAAKGTIRETLGASRPIDEANLANRLVRTFRTQYLEVTRLAREGL
jgi:iron(III) transport system substrate-binding protein